MKIENKKILLIGDLILDKYLIGDVNRISPESPVPVVELKSEENKLGGLANVALNIKNMGSEPIICSVVGNDNNGKLLKTLLNTNDIKVDYILESFKRKTTVKTRVIGNNYQIVRFDDEITTELKDDEYKILFNNIKRLVESNEIDIILLQDYDKGVINGDLINDIKKLVRSKIPIIVDPKLRNFNNYSDIRLFKPNLKEFTDGLRLNTDLELDEKLNVGTNILHKRGIEIVIVTLSEKGVYISYDYGKKTKIIPSETKNIIDVSGAGDTFISILSTLLTTELTIEQISYISNVGSGLVCELPGVVPVDLKKLKEKIEWIQ